MTVYEVDIRVGIQDGSVERRLQALSAQLDKTHGSVDRMSQAWTQLFVGHEMERFGSRGLSIFGGLVQAAAKLESAMLSVKAATGMSNDELERMTTFVQHLASTHTFSSTDAANMASIIATTTYKDPAQIRTLLNTMAPFADIMKSSKGMSVEESTKYGMQFADIVGGADIRQVAPLLDQFQRGALSSGGVGLSEYLTAFKAMAPALAQGADPKELMQIAALTSLKGLKQDPRQLSIDMLRIHAAETGALGVTKGGRDKTAAMRDLGLTGGAQGLFEQIAKIRAYGERRGASAADKRVSEAFTLRGEQALLNLLSPSTAATTKRLVDQWDKLPSLQDNFKDRMQSMSAIMSVTTTNLETFRTNLGTALEPFAKPGWKLVGTILGGLGDLARNHPHLAQGGLLAGGAGAAGLSIAGFLLKAGAFFKLLGGMKNGGLPVYVVNMAAGIGEKGIIGSVTAAAGGSLLMKSLIGIGAAIDVGLFANLYADIQELKAQQKSNDAQREENANLDKLVEAARQHAKATEHLQKATHHLSPRHAKVMHRASALGVGSSFVPSSTTNPSVGAGAGGSSW